MSFTHTFSTNLTMGTGVSLLKMQLYECLPFGGKFKMGSRDNNFPSRVICRILGINSKINFYNNYLLTAANSRLLSMHEYNRERPSDPGGDTHYLEYR